MTREAVLLSKNNPQRIEAQIKQKIAREIAEAVYNKVLERSYVSCTPYDMFHLLYSITCELNVDPSPKEDAEVRNEDTSY